MCGCGRPQGNYVKSQTRATLGCVCGLPARRDAFASYDGVCNCDPTIEARTARALERIADVLERNEPH